MEKGFCEVKDILNKYQINKIWNLSPKYYDAYINKICGDYLYESGIAYKNSKFSWIKNYFFHSFFIILGAIISIIRVRIYHVRPLKMSSPSNIIAMPFCGRYVFFKRLPQLLNKPTRVVYGPIFHYENIKKHIQEYGSNSSPEFYVFRMRDILASLYFLLKNPVKLNKCSKELDDVFGIYTGKFSKIFFFPILYGGFISKFLSSLNNSTEKTLWIFDYDYDYKYIIYNNFIHNLRKNDETLHIQHGSFIKEVAHYCCPVSDYSLCCSIREKRIIERYNPFKSHIHVLGAPLQTFDDEEKLQNTTVSYDILFLLTDAFGKKVGETQKFILGKMESNKYKIKLRYRPASKERDKVFFKDVVCGMDESIDSTLIQDVTMSKIVICFSEDALYTAIRLNKPIIYIRDEDIHKYFDLSHTSSFFHIIERDSFDNIDISYMIQNSEKCNYSTDSHIIDNFGYFNLSDVQSNMNSIISEILEK